MNSVRQKRVAAHFQEKQNMVSLEQNCKRVEYDTDSNFGLRTVYLVMALLAAWQKHFSLSCSSLHIFSPEFTLVCNNGDDDNTYSARRFVRISVANSSWNTRLGMWRMSKCYLTSSIILTLSQKAQGVRKQLMHAGIYKPCHPQKREAPSVLVLSTNESKTAMMSYFIRHSFHPALTLHSK